MMLKVFFPEHICLTNWPTNARKTLQASKNLPETPPEKPEIGNKLVSYFLLNFLCLRLVPVFFAIFTQGPVLGGRNPSPPLPKTILFHCTPPLLGEFSNQLKGKNRRSPLHPLPPTTAPCQFSCLRRLLIWPRFRIEKLYQNINVIIVWQHFGILDSSSWQNRYFLKRNPIFGSKASNSSSQRPKMMKKLSHKTLCFNSFMLAAAKARG